MSEELTVEESVRLEMDKFLADDRTLRFETTDRVGDLQPPPAASAPTPPIKLQPSQAPASRTFFKAIAHALSGATLGVLAGPAPVRYTTDETGKQIPDSNQPQDTAKDRVRRIAEAALTGLAAGAEAPRRLGANALAGLGAGFTTTETATAGFARKETRSGKF